MLDPIEYCCEKANHICADCALKRLYPRSDKACIDYGVAMIRNIVRHDNWVYENSLAYSQKA